MYYKLIISHSLLQKTWGFSLKTSRLSASSPRFFAQQLLRHGKSRRSCGTKPITVRFSNIKTSFTPHFSNNLGTGNNLLVTDFSFRFAPFEMTGVSQEKWVSGGSGEAAAARHPSHHALRSHFDRREKSIYYKLIISHSLTSVARRHIDVYQPHYLINTKKMR